MFKIFKKTSQSNPTSSYPLTWDEYDSVMARYSKIPAVQEALNRMLDREETQQDVSFLKNLVRGGN